MTTTMTVLNLILMAAVLVAVVAPLAWAIATQSRDWPGQLRNRRRGIDRREKLDQPSAARSERRRLQRRRVQRPYGHGLA